MIARRALLPAAVFAFGAARAAAPTRIVSIGGAITEAAFALGAGGQVAAVDTTSRFPPSVQNLPQIGYMRALAPEGLIALRPDLLLLSDEAGPAQALAVLHAAGLPIAVIHDGAGPGAAEAKIRAVAAALGVAAEPVAAAVAADWRVLDAPIAALARRPRALFVLSAARGAPLVSGRDTHADAMLRASGAENVVEGFTGYRPLSAEAAATLAPEAIIMMDHAIGEAAGVTASAGIASSASAPPASPRL